MKTIAHGTICGTVIVSWNSNLSHSFTFLKTWGKEPKLIFHNFEHSSLLSSLIKQKKKKLVMELYVTLLLTCTKTRAKRPKGLKTLKNCHFFKTLKTPSCKLRSSIKKQLHPQLHVPLFLFFALLT